MTSSNPQNVPTDIKERARQSRTRVFKVVFPDTTNHHHTLFGGAALKMMDETAFISATRFTRKKMVTIASGKVNFKESIPADTIIELVAEVTRVGRTSLEVEVCIFQEDMYKEQTRKKSISGRFTFVALDNTNNPTQIL